MTYRVTLRNGRSFEADAAQTLLDTARGAGVALEYSCRTGRCGICKAGVVAGQTRVLREEEALTPDERQAGVILTCCRAAAGDVVLDVEDLGRLAGVETRTLPCRIDTLERVAEDIVRVSLRTPPSGRLQFLPGQYVDVIRGAVRRSYSVGNAPRDDGRLELLVRRYAGGELSRYWFEQAAPDDLLRLEGPFGTFFLRDDGPRDLVFLATGTGIAPVKALVEELAHDAARRSLHRVRVYWGNREPASFVWHPQAGDVNTFERAISGGDSDWTGRRGYVHDMLFEDGFDPIDSAVYACGSTAMIAAARTRCLAAGLPAGRFFSDAFVSSS